MIQRIQSVWLLVVVIATSLMYIFPFFTVHTSNAVASLYFDGFFDDTSEKHKIIEASYSLLSLISIASLLSFISIFLFKNRNLQMRICTFTALIFIAITGLLIYFAYFSKETTEVAYNFPLLIPLVNVILLFLARRAINKDEKLVKSVDRIR